ncbi:carbohydrate ABC transporter permease [Paenibacillus humicola]|uniref:carbohydrate ABC transporter permease n=1 Tax=Paenibacillus humicola TaxID=3110540 RepID=UPI00237C3D84|nr:carbohydrate ABC transporter permease [Paenibacillus humicola]
MSASFESARMLRDRAQIGARRSGAIVVFNILGYSLVSVAALLCLIPFLMVISGSFTSDHAISNYGYSLIPKEFSVKAYSILFRYPEDILRAYGVSIFVTVCGTFLGLFLVSMTGYVLNRKDFRYRNVIAFFFYFTTLFNGGLVSYYIMMIRYYHLKDNLLSLIIPGILNVFYLIIMRSFMSSIPEAISESAKIDGAGDFTIFYKLILPLSKPALATIGLFIALEYWNDWYNAMLFITSNEKFPLQYMLYNMLSESESISRISATANVNVQDMPTQSLKLAMAVIATGPIIFAYPFVQKYFIRGITVGAVKG